MGTHGRTPLQHFPRGRPTTPSTRSPTPQQHRQRPQVRTPLSTQRRSRTPSRRLLPTYETPAPPEPLTAPLATCLPWSHTEAALPIASSGGWGLEPLCGLPRVQRGQVTSV